MTGNNSTPGKSRRKWLIPTVAAVVALASILLFVFEPFAKPKENLVDKLGIAAPNMGAYRAAIPELKTIEDQIGQGDYYAAVDIAEDALKKSEKALSQFAKKPHFGDEEWEYEYQSEKLLNSELRWMFIYLLMMVEDDRTAIKEVKKYLKDPDFCIHKGDAESILRALT